MISTEMTSILAVNAPGIKWIGIHNDTPTCYYTATDTLAR